MKTKRFLSVFLTILILSSTIFTSCTITLDDPGGSEESDSSSSESEQLPDEESSFDEIPTCESTSSETEETEEETVVITDVMIGETIEAEYAADFSVAKIFSNDMVVQRGEHIRVWGFAPESENGKKVSGEFKGMFAEALIENGEWCITFGARLEADINGAEMKIYASEKTVTFEGVLVGDVYLVMGQSNANYTVNNHLTYNDPATQGGSKSDIDPDSIIRLNLLSNSGGTYPKKGTDFVYSDLTNTKFWTKTTESDTLNFSALGYYFAKQLVEKNPSVPVGLMQVATGGAPLVSFLPNDLAEKWDGDYLDKASGLYYSNVHKDHLGRYFYNCYLSPVSRYAIAGVVWYQGESNNQLVESQKYNATFADLMNRLRSTHNVVNKEFPVFITELPSIYKKPADFTDSWHFMELGMIRSYMGSIPTVLDNSYVAVSSDLWSDRTFYNNLHPNCKYEQAGRLAAIADVVVNKNGTLESVTGPIFKSASISEDRKTVVVTFTNVGDGLATKDGGNAVLGIIGLKYSAMGHSVVTPISATITGKDQITVVFDTAVKAVAYNYESENFYGEEINLCNSFGCPASAFLSNYEERDLGEFPADSFATTSTTKVKFTKRAIDTLTANGNNLFTVGKVTSELAAAGNRVEITEGTTRLNTYGWIGFEYEIIMFGYSIDGGNAVFDTYPSAPGDAVINAGGQYAQRFSINVPISELSVGDHEIVFLALVEVGGGTAVNFFSFTLTVAPRPFIPDALDAPAYNESGYGFKAYSVDKFTYDGTAFFSGSIPTGLKEASYTVSVAKGTEKLRIVGWIGYETAIDMFGYAIDGEAVLTSTPKSAEAAVITAGGEYAMRYDTYVDISTLEAGYHKIDMLVRINTEDGSTVVLKILAFTLIIE